MQSFVFPGILINQNNEYDSKKARKFEAIYQQISSEMQNSEMIKQSNIKPLVLEQ